MLIPQADLLTLTGHLAAFWKAVRAAAGSTADNPPLAGTARAFVSAALAQAVAFNDYEMELDMIQGVDQAFVLAGVEGMVPKVLQTALQALQSHCQSRGPAANAAVQDLSSYLVYLNAVPYAAQVTPAFQDLFAAVYSGGTLNPAGVMAPGLSPDLGAYPNGMGANSVGGAFAAGAAVDPNRYSAAALVLALTADFGAGTAPPTVTAAGTDDAGALTTTWSAVLDSNNPAAAVAGTITPATNAQQRQTVALSSVGGIVAGSTLTVSPGLVDQEVVVVEGAPAGGGVTAVFQKAHAAGAAFSCKRSYALAPSVTGRRCRAVSGITLTLAGHAAGAVRVDGRQDRVAV